MCIFFLMKLIQVPTCSHCIFWQLFSARTVISVFKFYLPDRYASAMTEVPIKVLIVTLNNININHTYFLIPPWSWHLFSDQLLPIQPEFLMLGHTKTQQPSRPNSMCLKISLLIYVRIISACLATAMVQKVAISYYAFWFPVLYSLFPSQRPLSCNYSCPPG